MELLDMKLTPSPSMIFENPEKSTTPLPDLAQSELTPPDYPNNWRVGGHDSKDDSKDDRSLYKEKEQMKEGLSLQKNLLNVNLERDDFSGRSLNPSALLKPPSCWRSKMPICVLGILVFGTLMSSLGALTLSINNYTNEKYRFNQLETQFLQIQAKTIMDREFLENLFSMYARVNETVDTLPSQMSQLQSIVESQTSQMTSIKVELQSTNQEHQRRIDSLNTSFDTQSSQVFQLQTFMHATSNRLVSQIIEIEAELLSANQTQTRTQQQINSLNITSDTLLSQVFQLQSTMQDQSNSLASQIIGIEAELQTANQTQARTQQQINSLNTSFLSQFSQLESIMQDQSSSIISQITGIQEELHLANQTQTKTQQQINSLNTSSTSAVNILSSLLQSIMEDVGSRFVLIDEALNSTKNATDVLLARFLGNQEAKLMAIASKLLSIEAHANTTRDSVQSQFTIVRAELTRELSSFAVQLNNTTVQLNQLSGNVSYTQMALQYTNHQLNSTIPTIASLTDGQVSTRHALNVTNSNLNAVRARFSKISSAFHSLSASLTSPLEIYSGCYRDKVNCTVFQHQSTPYWYRCTTASVRINTPVSTIREGGRDLDAYSYRCSIAQMENNHLALSTYVNSISKLEQIQKIKRVKSSQLNRTSVTTPFDTVFSSKTRVCFISTNRANIANFYTNTFI